jgi:hypothetical protein
VSRRDQGQRIILRRSARRSLDPVLIDEPPLLRRCGISLHIPIATEWISESIVLGARRRAGDHTSARI